MSIFVGRASRTIFVSISESNFQLAGFKIRGFRMEHIAKINFPPKSFFVNFEIYFLGGWGAWKPFFRFSCALKKN